MKSLVLVCAMGALFVPAIGRAAIIMRMCYTVDFTDAEDAAQNATWSAYPRQLDLTKDGLGWNEKGDTSPIVCIQTKPIALGLSWRPPCSISIYASAQQSIPQFSHPEKKR